MNKSYTSSITQKIYICRIFTST